jgi:hypothetical protein
LIAGLRGIKQIPLGHSAYHDELLAYITDLIHIGQPASSAAIDVVLDLLDPKSPLMLNSDELARTALRAVLLYSLVRLGLPEDTAKQGLVLLYVMQALAGDNADTFLAAATIVAVLGVVGKEAVPLLMRPLRPGFAFADIKKYNYPFFRIADSRKHAAIPMAIRALGKLGPLAAEALPLLKPIAERPLASADYPTDEAIFERALVETSREAQRAIQGLPAATDNDVSKQNHFKATTWEQWFGVGELFNRE